MGSKAKMGVITGGRIGLVAALLVCYPLVVWGSGPDALSRGLGEFERGNYRQAEEAFNAAIRSDPESAEAYYYLGESLSRQGEYEKAAAALQKTIVLAPEFPGARLSLGIVYYRMGAYQRAETELKQGLTREPNNGAMLFFLGLTYQSMERYDESVVYFNRAKAADVEFAQLAWFNIGTSRMQQGEPQAAQSAFREAVKLDPTSDVAAAARQSLANLGGAEPKRKRWAVLASAGFEYDDNVTVSEIDQQTAQSDIVGVFEFSGEYRLLESPEYELDAGYDFYQSLYEDLSEFDLQSHSGWLGGSHEIIGADVGLGYRYTYTSLGDNSFLEIHNIAPTLGFTAGVPNWYVNLRYDFQDKNFFEDDARDADQHAFGLDNYLFFMQERAYALLSYRLEDEDTTGPEFDYLGHYVTVGVQIPAPLRFIEPTVKLSYQYFVKDYDNITASIGEERQDERHTVGFSLTQPLTEILIAKLDYQYIDAISNLDTSDFSENIVTVSLGVSF